MNMFIKHNVFISSKVTVKSLTLLHKINAVHLNFLLNQRILKNVSVSTKILNSTVFNINNTCFSSSKSAYYNDF